jgi:hypothetical protein
LPLDVRWLPSATDHAVSCYSECSSIRLSLTPTLLVVLNSISSRLRAHEILWVTL